MPSLDVDVWCIISEHLYFEDVCAVRLVCSDWHERLKEIEEVVAIRYARVVLGDKDFWNRAHQRPENTRKSLKSWHAEVVRVDLFVREAFLKTASDFYRFWDIVDKV